MSGFLPFAGDTLVLEVASLPELRAELLREAKDLLARWERTRADEDRGRLLQALEHLALLVRSGHG